VPQVDADGNDLGGVRYPDMRAPIATYIGWALRKAGFAEGELMMTNGLHQSVRRHPKPSAKKSAIRACRSRSVIRVIKRTLKYVSALSMNWSGRVLLLLKTVRITFQPGSGTNPLDPGGDDRAI
jgi:hypothetical protein